MQSTASDAVGGRETSGGFRRFWRALKQLFHEMIGGVFSVLALVWLQNSLRAWSRDVPRWIVGLALGTAVLMACFAWTSFRRAKAVR